MRKFILNKVVRSGIPKLMQQAGSIIESRELTDDEAFEALMDKLVEESHEAKKASREDRAAELADLRRALKDAELVSGIAEADINAAEVRQDAKKGGFVPTTYVVSVTVQNDDPMAEYYAGQPDRFTEVTPD